ncbi:alpha/beta hydrolase-fold protein [Mangrovibacter plantisponsor]|uniref:Enterochelin esterase-like enzyme n=1 Tax=Mangrovibacter plantisponsor TaxID=451513 RepID=A0A317Q6W3_9ENTR|nr:alpha/beta hydrolase-fold protein [Mangrovibacter plantisponsor]PWW11785.1 enterochelin esterase-like enzyme [Mangrovibacter plantisponsor]
MNPVQTGEQEEQNGETRGLTRRVLAQLAGKHVADVDQFWRDVAALVTPLVSPGGNGATRAVTFLWRSCEPLYGVYLRLNRVTDKDQVARGMLQNLPGTDIWFLTLQLPATYCGSYTFTEIPPGVAEQQLVLVGGRNTPFASQPDAFNTALGIRLHGGGESVLSLDKADAQSEWRDRSAAPAGITHTRYSVVAGRERRLRLYLPDVPRSVPLGLLVLPDAESWFDNVGVLQALDVALSRGRIAPFAVLGVDNLSLDDRTAILGGETALIDNLAQRIIPGVLGEYADRAWAGRERTVLSGQSLGGVTALMAALVAADTFGAVFSHSPSMWWTPDGSRRPFMFSENDTSWVSEQVMAAPPARVKLRLCVGSLEGATVPHVEDLHHRLLVAGADSTLAVYTGGHDFAWWRVALIDGLAALLPQHG